MIVLLPAVLSLGSIGLGVARQRSRARARKQQQKQADRVGRIGGACCRDCALDQAAGRMPVGSTCSPCSQAQAHGVQCSPPPFLVDPVDAVIGEQYRRGATVDEATITVLESVYPATPDGQRIPWRSLSGRDAQCLHDLVRRVRARALFGFAQEALALATNAESMAAAQWAQRYGGE